MDKASNGPALQAHNLSCRRVERILWQDLSFQIFPGQLMQVSGGNGCGKTSLLRVITGLAAPSAGEIYWHGQSIHQQITEYQQQLYYLGHQIAVKGELTVKENLLFNFRMNKPLKSSFDSIVNELNLMDFVDNFGYQLSQGQKQKVALAQLLLNPSPLWILDEPFTSLDSHTMDVMQDNLALRLAAGATIILTTHRPLTLSKLSAQILSLE